MHQFKSSASPYLCEITLDASRGFSVSDVSIFKSKVERGVAVYGYTPNVLLCSKGAYGKWESIGKFLVVLDTGKVSICGSGLTDSLFSLMQGINPNIQLKYFDESQKAKARAWLCT